MIKIGDFILVKLFRSILITKAHKEINALIKHLGKENLWLHNADNYNVQLIEKEDKGK